MTQDEAEALVRGHLAQWLRRGKDTFTVRELLASGVADRAGRSRTWLYACVSALEEAGLAVAVRCDGPWRWKILPAVLPPVPPALDEAVSALDMAGVADAALSLAEHLARAENACEALDQVHALIRRREALR